MRYRSVGPKLRPSLHYMLNRLSRGPRFYARSINEITRLEKRGFAAMTGATSTYGSREWQITDAGRLALATYPGGEV